MSYSGQRGSSYGSQIRRARMVQARRTPHAKEIDSGLKAPIAKNVEQWLSAPNRYDLPDVDMNKPKEAEKKREPDKPFEPKPLTHSEIQRRLAYHKVMGTTH